MIRKSLTYLAAAGVALMTASGCAAEGSLDPAEISSNLVVFTDASKSLADRNLIEVPVGELLLSDGRLVAMDPLVQPETKPFARRVEPGTYPVSFIRGTAEYSRPAFLVIRFSSEKIERFELATIEGQDVNTLKDDEFFGIGVDAGLAAFANADYGASQTKFQEAEQSKPGSRYSNYYDDKLSHSMTGQRSDEATIDRPLESDAGAAAIIQSGWGDGFYPTFWGLNKDGKPVLALIDFFVIENGDGRSDEEKEEASVLAQMTEQQQADNKAAYKALQEGDDKGFAKYVAEKRIAPKDYILGQGGSFMFEVIRQDRPAALRAMIEAGADNALGPHDGLLDKSYAAFAHSMNAYAAKAKAEGKSTPAPRSQELMDLVAELEKRPGSSDQLKSSTQE
ncbi:DUF4241 domain-containing protein [Agrobacterium larrymoorei]|uniref:DUF4241 domain-containing protein n=1 Tax=Agrobacterium larrymoorei TaxID=160699 RepID=A0A4D7DRB9_9HYPH|nr:DUF4241 domain-containing protein [Agrobacterium larrymoorei]QCI96842.1 DUF4241 domain-containing protein [Agrobacterium larrymoorei]QYA07732.1 DUF4241 domain-containing protein [Agrobacterium larrymoorei]